MARGDIEARAATQQPAPEPQPWCSWFVPLIFIACLSLFVYSMYRNDCPHNKIDPSQECILEGAFGRFSFQPFKDNYLMGPSIRTLRDLGALDQKLVLMEDEKWRLFSCIWLHAGLIHLFANMLSLLFIGIRLEQDFGFLRIGVLYILAGLGGSMLSCLGGKRDRISVGASGALFGLLGAMLSDLITNWTIYANKCMALTILVVVIILNLAVGFIPGVDNSAHIGGFITGVLLGFIVLVCPQYGYISKKYLSPGNEMKRKPKYNLCQLVSGVIALVLLIAGYAVGLKMLFKGETVKLPFPEYHF